jgi:indolepyruvate ferredoxin oxidoreductase
LRRRLADAAGDQAIIALPASALAERLLGDTIYANLLLLGAAFQSGHVPLSLAAIERAIELNAESVDLNLRAFAIGRHAVLRPQWADAAVGDARSAGAAEITGVEQLIADRMRRLTEYHDSDYAERFAALLRQTGDAQTKASIDGDALARAVASAFYRLLAIKDEYEVARLYTDGEFEAELDRRFEPGYRVRYHLAPPGLARVDRVTGRPRKIAFGPWLRMGMRLLARLRRVRGTVLDPFGYSDERRLERRVARDYERTLGQLLSRLSPANHRLVLEYAALPEQMRGFGAVKRRNIDAALKRADEITAQVLQGSGQETNR